MEDNTLTAATGNAATEMEMAGYSFSDIEFVVNNHNLLDKSEMSHVYHEPYEYNTKLLMNGIRTMEAMACRHITVCIYDAVSGNEIYASDYEPSYDDDDLTLYIHEETGSLPPGRYELSIENAIPSAPSTRLKSDGYGCTMEFEVLPNGTSMVHPCINEAHCAITEGNDGQPVLRLTATIDRDCTDDDYFDCCLFDNSLMIMDDSVRAERTGRSLRRLTTCISPAYALTAGCYLCIMRHNGAPFAMFEVTVAAEGGVSAGDVAPVCPSSVYYTLGRQADTISGTKPLFRTAGYRDMKIQALKFGQACCHNAYRHKESMPYIEPCMHHIFYGNGTESERKIIEAFIETAFPTMKSCVVDVAEICGIIANGNQTDAVDEAMSEDDVVVVVRNAGGLLMPTGKQIAKTMERRLEATKRLALVVWAKTAEKEMLDEALPKLTAYIPQENRMTFAPLAIPEAIHAIQRLLDEKCLKLSPKALAAISTPLAAMAHRNRHKLAEADFCRHLVDKAIMPCFRQRMFADGDGRYSADREFLTTVLDCDIDMAAIDDTPTPLAEALEEVGSLIGLHEVKTTIRALAMRARFDVAMRNRGKTCCNRGAYHMIFTGSPGTGKTTVAKKLGRIFRSLGILSEGNVVVAERGSIVGRFLGQTEENMMELLEQAKGNVLFIDEAYTLCDSTDDRKDYGYRAIECLLTVLAQKRPDMVIILAGYEDEMDRMLNANQGLRGRFPYHLRFDSYNAGELVEIGARYMKAYDIGIADDARQKLHAVAEEQTARHDRQFSNARWMEQMVDNGIIPAMSERMFSQDGTAHDGNADGGTNGCDGGYMVTADDIDKALKLVSDRKIQKKIGF